jgi:hypothetical protein
MGLSERVTESTASVQTSPDGRDALALLEEEHRLILKLFDDFETADALHRTRIVDELCATLRLHAQLEEEILYPAAHDAITHDGELIDDTGTEHASIKVLVGRLEQTGPLDEHYDALVRVLADYVKYHLEEEEQRLFPRLRVADLDLLKIGLQLSVRRNELRAHRS